LGCGLRPLRALGSESGQTLPFAVILLCVLVLLTFGAMGAAAAEGVHGRLQAAGDAAALAAAAQAEVWERLTVQRHLFACRRKRKTWDCYDAWDAPVTFRDGYESLWSGGGWVRDAGCRYTSDGQAGVPPSPDPATVCDTWRLDQAGFDYPPGSDPVGAARAYFAANVSGLRAHGVSVGEPQVALDPATGAVTVSAAAVEGANPLSLLLGHGLTVSARGGAKPQLTVRLRQSGP
jgi:hypothetical protein